MVQTPQQRRANEKFAREQQTRMGKSEGQMKKRTKETAKSPISTVWLVALALLVCGGLLFEILSRFFKLGR